MAFHPDTRIWGGMSARKMKDQPPPTAPQGGHQGASRPRGWADYPNLRQRPHAPNKGRGRLQRQIRRAFIVHGNEVSSSTIYAWCKRWQAPVFGQWERWSIVRILETIAVRVRKVPPYQAW